MKPKTLFLLLLVALAFGVSLLFLSDSFSTYTDFQTAAESGREVHVVARWVNRENAGYDPSLDEFRFQLQDSLNKTVTCIYPDPKPANLENADKLVVIGKHDGQVFRAEKILLKCPSKYKNEQPSLTPAQPTRLN